MRKFLFVLCIFLLGIGLFFLFSEKARLVPFSNSQNSGVRIHMLDIGQGDSILIQTSEANILVDTGPPDAKEKIFQELDKYQVEKLDYLILTHAHADHIGNAAVILEKIPVLQVIESSHVTASPLVKKYYETMKKKKIPLKIPKKNEIIDLGNQEKIRFFTPLPEYQNTTNINNSSLVFMFSFGSVGMLFTGDMEKELEKSLVLEYGNELQADILKSPHHGSSTSSSKIFLEAVKPEIVLISLGKDNSYGHPHKNVVKRYESLKVNIFRTDLNHNITIQGDSQGYHVNVERKGTLK